MEYKDILTESAKIFNDRNPKYGDMRISMDRAAQIATLITGLHMTAHDVSLVLHAVKLSRIGNDRANPEHYVDGINYFAFAAELVTEPTVQDDDPSMPHINTAEIAARFSPQNPVDGI